MSILPSWMLSHAFSANTGAPSKTAARATWSQEFLQFPIELCRGTALPTQSSVAVVYATKQSENRWPSKQENTPTRFVLDLDPQCSRLLMTVVSRPPSERWSWY